MQCVVVPHYPRNEVSGISLPITTDDWIISAIYVQTEYREVTLLKIACRILP